VTKIESSQVWIPVARGHLALTHRPKMTAFAGLREQGCTAMLTLLSAREGAEAIGAAASRVGIEWIWLPLETGDPPSDERDEEVRGAFDRVRDLLMSGGHLLIHCSAGIHRTGMVGYAFLRHLGLAQEDAKTILRSLRTVTADGVGETRLTWGERFGQGSGAPPGNTM